MIYLNGMKILQVIIFSIMKNLQQGFDIKNNFSFVLNLQIVCHNFYGL